MKQNSKLLLFTGVILLWFFFVICAVLLVTGCLHPSPANNSHIGNPVPFGPEWLDAMIEVAQAFSLANAASTTVNPYAIPISVGLAAIAAGLEALRRKEKSGRKHAEQELNNNNNNK